MKKRMPKGMKPVLLLGASATLLLLSTVGSTRAALTYYSDYAVEVSVSSIGVSLMENGKVVSHRNYDNNTWSSDGTGTLLSGMLGEGEKLKPGKTYEENLSVFNSGAIDTYVRVILTRSWMDAKGNKDTNLTPALIALDLASAESGWVMDENASTPERMILYYTKPLASGQSTPAFCEGVTIDPTIGAKVTKSETLDENGSRIITTECAYNGYQFHLEAEVDAVQTHSGEDAIKSAWGVDAAVVEDGSLSIR